MSHKVIAYFANELDLDRAADALVKHGVAPDAIQVINPAQPGVVEDDKLRPRPFEGPPDEADRGIPPAVAATSAISGAGLLDGKPGLAPLVDSGDRFGLSAARPRDLLLDAGVPEAELDFFSDALAKSGGVLIVTTAVAEAQTIAQLLTAMNGRTAEVDS
jgi:hypothetical protein